MSWEGVAGMQWSQEIYLKSRNEVWSKQMPEWSYGVHMSKLMSNYHANWDSNYSTNKGLFWISNRKECQK